MAFQTELPPPPPPPCPTSKSAKFPSDSFKKGIGIQEDPFLRAYKKCTGSPINGKLTSDGKTDRGRPKINVSVLYTDFQKRRRLERDTYWAVGFASR
ncbi:hypothetical protein POTOM_060340 [Populus tomentosa]|uniref:Uncharacterized protein n=1 Tax=Populus tomentosa TaxID=118781 RepID=A0A8X8C217_POPTO|nr:hypothetical protein POTOM_060340 [Populus tomentosa]